MHMQCPECGGQLNLVTRLPGENDYLGDAICQSCFLDWWYRDGEWRAKPSPPPLTSDLSDTLKKYYTRVLLENARVH